MKQILGILFLLLILCCKRQSLSQQNVNAEIPAKPNANNKVRSATQEHLYTDLSHSLNYVLKFTKARDSSNTLKDYWTVVVWDKKTKLSIDSLKQSVGMMYDLQNFKNVRSLITGKNRNKEPIDNDYGDLIIADLNFDAMDDIALVNDLGGNGGRFYSYYIQQKDHKFILDKFLTDSMVYFPSKLLTPRKQLITYVHAGVCGLGEHVYTYKTISSEWKETQHRLINICNE